MSLPWILALAYQYCLPNMILLNELFCVLTHRISMKTEDEVL